MALNIKNDEVHRLVREAARITGRTQTSVIEAALRKYLDDLRRDERRHDADALLADMQRRLAAAPGPRMRPDDLYDPETGLPA